MLTPIFIIQLGKTCDTLKCSFHLLLGDNFYLEPTHDPVEHDGVNGTSDVQWNTIYRRVYTAASLNIPFFAILGNHDYYAGAVPQAEILYTRLNLDNRWNMPDHNYTLIYTIPGSSQTLQLVFIDTPRISPKTSSTINPSNYLTLQAEAIAWLKQTLAASTATYLIVCGHYHSEYIYSQRHMILVFGSGGMLTSYVFIFVSLL